MTPTLVGRLQSRLITAAIIGVPATLILGWLAPAPLVVFLYGLLAAVMIGLGLDLIYYWLQHRRWDKDWPPLFFMVSAVIEFGLLLAVLYLSLPVSFFSLMYIGLHFWSIWLGTMVVIFQLIHVVRPLYKYSGGHMVRSTDITSRL